MTRRRTQRSIVSVAVLVCTAAGIWASNLAAQAPPRQQEFVDRSQEPKYKADRVLVRFRPNVTRAAMQAVHNRIGTSVLSEPRIVDRLQVVQIKPGASVGDTIRRYRADTSVLYAEPDYIVRAFDIIPNDPQFPMQWNLKNTGQSGGKPGADIHAAQAWSLMTGSSSVVVAVLDTGMDYTHPELSGQVWTAATAFSATGDNDVAVNCPAGSHGLNAVAESCDPMDDNGHGTHISGIIGAAGNNGIGVTGINWNVTILPCKFLDTTGTGDLSSVIGCLDLVKTLKDSGVHIVATNNSWADSKRLRHCTTRSQLN